jgi:hypothetical protein
MCDPAYARLPGARAEANAIVKRLTAPGALPAREDHRVDQSRRRNAAGARRPTILNALMARDWRIVHVSATANRLVRQRFRWGAVRRPGSIRTAIRAASCLSECSFLGPREIENMRVVPELVFVNCCHLAARNSAQLVRKYDRARFAATVAEEADQHRRALRHRRRLGGRRCDRQRVRDDVLRCNIAVRAPVPRRSCRCSRGGAGGGRQHVGGVVSVLRRPGLDLQASGGRRAERCPPVDRASLGSPSAIGLENALETLEVESKFQGRTGEAQRVRLYNISRTGSAPLG